MAITPIRYNGKTYDPDMLTTEDSKTLYRAHRNHEINLLPEHLKVVQDHLSSKEMEDIDYEITDEHNATKNGENGAETIGVIEEEDGTKKNAKEATDGKNEDAGVGMGGNVAIGGAVGVGILSILGAILTKTGVLEGSSKTNGFVALIASATAAAMGGAVWAMSGRDYYDPGAKVREQYKNKSEEYNTQMDGKKEALEESVSMMEEDTEAYTEANEELSVQMNTKELDIVDLEQKIAEANARGDVVQAKKYQDELNQLQETDFNDDMDELEETREKLADYQTFNDEAVGMHESGLTVQQFLDYGNQLTGPAKTAKTMLIVGAVTMALCAVYAAIPKIFGPFGIPLDKIPGTIAAVVYAVAGAMMGKAASNFGNNASFEEECGNSGTKMSSHVNDLKGQIDPQQQTIDKTTEGYDKNDEEQEEIRAEGEEKASELRQQFQERLANGIGNEKDDGKGGKDGEGKGDNTSVIR